MQSDQLDLDMVMPPQVVTGFAPERLLPSKNGRPWNELENSFADTWAEWQARGFPQKLQDFKMTKKELMLVADMMQWLGTNVGIGFVEESLKRVGHRIKWDYERGESARMARHREDARVQQLELVNIRQAKAAKIPMIKRVLKLWKWWDTEPEQKPKELDENGCPYTD